LESARNLLPAGDLRVGYWIHSIQDKEWRATMSTTKTDAKASQQFIAGEWAGAAGGRTFEDLDPFTGDVVATVQSGSHPFPF
jgi:hypothetical protein